MLCFPLSNFNQCTVVGGRSGHTVETGFLFKAKKYFSCQEITLSGESLNPQAPADSRQKKLISCPNANI